MSKKRRDKFEFYLYIINKDGKRSIICQRYFDVDGYNPKVVKSVESKYMLDECVSIFRNNLRGKAEDYLWRYHNPYKVQDPESVNIGQNNYAGEDFFEFEVKANGRCLGISRITANDFPPRVKYDVNIKTIIPELVETLEHYMSLNTYTNSFCEIEQL